MIIDCFHKYNLLLLISHNLFPDHYFATRSKDVFNKCYTHFCGGRNTNGFSSIENPRCEAIHRAIRDN
jgi:hypothetical protein